MSQGSLVFLRPFSYIAMSRAQEQTTTSPTQQTRHESSNSNIVLDEAPLSHSTVAQTALLQTRQVRDSGGVGRAPELSDLISHRSTTQLDKKTRLWHFLISLRSRTHLNKKTRLWHCLNFLCSRTHLNKKTRLWHFLILCCFGTQPKNTRSRAIPESPCTAQAMLTHTCIIQSEIRK